MYKLMCCTKLSIQETEHVDPDDISLLEIVSSVHPYVMCTWSNWLERLSIVLEDMRSGSHNRL